MKTVALGFAKKYDDGNVPSIAANQKGTVVEVHQSEGAQTIWYHVGELTGAYCSFGSSVKYDNGRTPSVALNDDNIAVEVHRSNGLSSNMWYHVGTVDPSRKRISWGGSHKYDSGAKPSVAINNSGTVVEVHESDGLSSNMWYHVGTVNPSRKTIDWGESVKYDSGVTPNVAMNNQGVVVEVHQSNGPSTNLWYHVGKVNTAKKRIDWGGSHQYDSGASPSVALTDDGFVIEVHQSQVFNTLWMRVGTVDLNRKVIQWSTKKAIEFDSGSSPSVACNNLLAIVTQQRGNGLYASASFIMDRATWMKTSMAQIGQKTLRQLVMPGTHDAAMYKVEECTGAIGFGANACNTKTQTNSFLNQLKGGARYFDVRPVIYKGVMATGHFNTDPLLGCNGPSMEILLKDVETFMKGSQELAILKFSHYLDRDNESGFSRKQMEALIDQVLALLEPYLYKGEALIDTPLATMLQQGGRIIAAFAGLSSALQEKYKGRGIYKYADAGKSGDLVVYDKYSNTNDLKKMVSNQLNKLKNSSNHRDNLFLLSWTLTQSQAQAIACGANIPNATSILDLAAEANTVLWPNIVDSLQSGIISTDTVPNIVYYDAAQGLATDVAVWLNEQLK